METTFKRYCIVCALLLPYDRLRRGSVTCSSECHKADRRAYMRFRREIGKARLLASGWFRKIVREAAHSVREVSRSRSMPENKLVAASRLPEYRIYQGAKARCTNPNRAAWKDYGGRGIEFRFESFRQFYEVVGPRPSKRHMIDRIDNDRHYEPGNVRWVTQEQQNVNRARLRRFSGKLPRDLGPTEKSFDLEEHLLKGPPA